MQKQGKIVRYTAEELDEMLRRGEDETDWERVAAMTEEELEAAIDPAEEGEFDWDSAQIGIPGPRQQLTMWLDRDVADWFKAQAGAAYQVRMNAVLRNNMETQKQRQPVPTPGG